MSHRRIRRPLIPLISAALLTVALAWPAAAAPTITTIATGLDNPRGLAFGPNGALYIAEAGEGGDDYCFTHPEFGELCGGPSGAITRVWRGAQERVVEGLPSHARDATGIDALGPEDVSPHGNGNLFIPLGFGGDPAEIPGLPNGGDAHGWLIRANPGGQWRLVANIAAHEGAVNPDGVLPPDTNPNSVAGGPSGLGVVDAGGNDLLAVRHGQVSTLAVFPARMVPAPFPPLDLMPMQSVPDSVVIGPDGAYYVGELTGFPFVPETARVHRVTAGGAASLYVGEGWFTNIMDIAFGPDGSLYVLEISHNGFLSGDPTGGLWRVPPGGGDPELLLTEPLFLPGGITVGPDGALYVTNCAPCANDGWAVRIDL